MKKVSAKAFEVMRLFSVCPNLPQFISEKIVITAYGKELIWITKDSIESVVASLTNSVFMARSNVPDEFLSMIDIGVFVKRLQSYIKRLDHIGFCYAISSQEDERERIINEVIKTDWHLYEMESVDLAKWYFIGDKRNWQDPMIELLPVVIPHEIPEDLSYWMPHIHIDINTSLSVDEIVKMSTDTFGNTRKPMLYTDPKWGTHCVRIWLGVISGMNFQLDLSTKVRNLEWVRKNMLHEIKV